MVLPKHSTNFSIWLFQLDDSKLFPWEKYGCFTKRPWKTWWKTTLKHLRVPDLRRFMGASPTSGIAVRASAQRHWEIPELFDLRSPMLPSHWKIAIASGNQEWIGTGKSYSLKVSKKSLQIMFLCSFESSSSRNDSAFPVAYLDVPGS